MFTKFIKVIKQIKRYLDAKDQTEKWLQTFDEAADAATSYEEYIFNVVPPFCNADFWLRRTEKEGDELKKLLNN